MTNLIRNQKYKIPFCGTDVEVQIKIPSAIESEEIIVNELKITEIFSRFVTSVSCPTISDFNKIEPKEVLSLPGTYSLVQKTAQYICSAACIPAGAIFSAQDIA